MRPASSTVGLVVLALAACSDDCPEPFADCIETSVTLDQGVYGRTFAVDDVIHDENCGATKGVSPNVELTLSVPNGAQVGTTTSDENGVFEISAPEGQYTLCIRQQTCSWMVSVPATGRSRVDVQTGFLGEGAFPRAPASCGR